MKVEAAEYIFKQASFDNDSFIGTVLNGRSVQIIGAYASMSGWRVAHCTSSMTQPEDFPEPNGPMSPRMNLRA